MNDLSSYVVGVTGGYNYSEIFKKAVREKVFRVDMVTSSTPELQHLKKLAVGRIDLVIIELNVGNYLIRKNAPLFDSIDFTRKKIDERSFHLGFSKAYPNAKALFKQFNAELVKFAAEGKRQAIHKKYGIITEVDASINEWKIPDRYRNWEIAENTFVPPLLHYTITCDGGRLERIDYNMHTRIYTSDGTPFPHFNVAADAACR